MDTQKELNLSYLLEEAVKKAYEEKDCLFLARLILVIMEQNPDIKIKLDLKTLDWVVYARLVAKFEDIEYDEKIQEAFNSVSEGILQFLEFIIQRRKGGKL